MTIFNALNLIGGLCLFLFGMNLMGQALERRAGSGLRSLLEKMTQNRLMGLLAGLGVTAVIQSSSATTVMVVGFVNSGVDDAAAVHRRYHGRQYRYHRYGLDPQPLRYRGKQPFGANV